MGLKLQLLIHWGHDHWDLDDVVAWLQPGQLWWDGDCQRTREHDLTRDSLHSRLRWNCVWGQLFPSWSRCHWQQILAKGPLALVMEVLMLMMTPPLSWTPNMKSWNGNFAHLSSFRGWKRSSPKGPLQHFLLGQPAQKPPQGVKMGALVTEWGSCPPKLQWNPGETAQSMPFLSLFYCVIDAIDAGLISLLPSLVSWQQNPVATNFYCQFWFSDVAAPPEVKHTLEPPLLLDWGYASFSYGEDLTGFLINCPLSRKLSNSDHDHWVWRS